MKKINIFILVLALFLSPFKIAQAESSCSYDEQVELNNLAANVETTYEAIDIYEGKSIDIDGSGEEVDVYTRGLRISILNITDAIYVKLINKNTEEEKTFYYKDTTDGIATFDTAEVDDITDYDVEIYVNKYSCVGDLNRKYSFSTPRYNLYSELETCKNNPDFYYCQEFVEGPEIDNNQFYTNLTNYQKEEEKKEEQEKNLVERIKEIYKNHALVINLTAGVIIIAGVTTTVILVKKRRSRIL